MKNSSLYLAMALVLGAVSAAPHAFAKGRPGEETAAQNLSVPAILVGPLGALSCGTPEAPSALVKPMGVPLSGYEVPGDYWVQKVHTWQAQCFNSDQAQVFGNWGDNLKGDARLKTGSPIRVELVLTNMTAYSTPSAMQGYAVLKLEPSKLDRLSAYGHAAIGDGGGWGDVPVDHTSAQWLVHDAGITFSVMNKSTGAYAVEPGTSPTAEINATGKVVYGYNLRVETAGAYRIQFTTSGPVTFTGQDAANGGQVGLNDVFIDIQVVAGGGGGGKGGRN